MSSRSSGPLGGSSVGWSFSACAGLLATSSAGHIHEASQHLIDACLIATPLLLEPPEHVRVNPNRDRFFLRWPWYKRLREEFVLEFRDVAIVDVLVAQSIDPRQVALDSALFRGHWPS